MKRIVAALLAGLVSVSLLGGCSAMHPGSGQPNSTPQSDYNSGSDGGAGGGGY